MEKTSNKSLLFKALGDETRFKIVSILLGGEKCACVIPKLVNRAQPTVSLQLKYLTNLGILSSRRDGKMILYKIGDQRICDLIKLSNNLGMK